MLIKAMPVILSFSVYIFFYLDTNPNFVYLLIITSYFIGALLVSSFIRKEDPSKGALIMGLGIVSLGPVHTVNLAQEPEIVPFLLIGLWLQISMSYIKNFNKWSFQDANHTFLHGTWVAATSVVGVSVLFYYPQEPFVSKLIAVLAAFLWAGYAVLSIYTFQKLIFSKIDLERIHGGILLTVVATQSVVIVMEWTFDLLKTAELILISIGILFYLGSIGVLIIRYARNTWTIVDDWKNTNCIVHGALSITGVAWLNIGASSSSLGIYWLLVFIVFLIIELMELYRASQRIKHLGISQGIYVYHPSQWARIFTFGMFYYFTTICKPLIPVNDGYLTVVDASLLILGPVIILLTIIQLLIMGYPILMKATEKAPGN
ncbi:hypothetical protein [Bacillus sp. Marseille-Q3570]|uniref:SLAC1 family transporter n=1 Tax=Bacillus sp. Marseille-Q3570 TaxID=2963522 RepID=UPI0021B846EB|nr:hypothetical protein [Bacillus sp. Marseille-Q3570]